MKKIITLLFLLLTVTLYVKAQTYIDTTGGRYWNEIFSNVTVTSNITYGQNTTVSGTNQVLKLDVYQPTGDTVMMRPLLVLAHGGSFIGGSKTDQDVVSLCNHFAKMGYVCTSLDYRLGMGFPIDSIHAAKAVLRAVQDMKAAVRFFRQDAATVNTYHIHPDYVFAGGSSAGAFTALHMAYMDSAEVPAYVGLAGMGGIEGNSGNPGYASNVKAVINLCGALGDSSWLNTGDIPFVSMHGTNDGTVPYGSAIIVVLFQPILEVDGSSSLKIRADNIGVNNPFYSWPGADHVPYAGTSATALAYMDTTLNFVKAFLRPFFGIPPTGIAENESNVLNIYPNPATDEINFSFSKNNFEPVKVLISDVTGKTIDAFNINSSQFKYKNKSLKPGVYFVKITSGKKETIKKLVIQ
ncbi:MAG: T9SS type A sorting domain-containing protein [Bacteroidia bacterium]